MADHSTIDHTGITGVGAAAFAGAHVSNSGVQSISTATWTSLTFDTEEFDTDAFHSTVTNTSRLTVPSGKGGKYLIGGVFSWAGNANGTRNGRIYLNNTTRLIDVGWPPHTTAAAQRFPIMTVYDLAVADYVELQVFQDSGGSLNTSITGFSTVNFWMYKVG